MGLLVAVVVGLGALTAASVAQSPVSEPTKQLGDLSLMSESLFFPPTGDPIAMVSVGRAAPLEFFGNMSLYPTVQGVMALAPQGAETVALDSAIGDLCGLVLLYTRNALHGPIPTQVGLLHKMVNFDLTSNDLSGAIPTQIGRMENAVAVFLEDTPLTGPIPSQLGNLQQLAFLRLTTSQLEGGIPSQLFLSPALRELKLHANALVGSVPSQIGTATILGRFLAHTNRLSGALPTQVGQLATVVVFDVSNNALSGPLPSQLGLMGGVTTLGLHDNAFSGALPSQLALLTGLTALNVQDNALSSVLPSQLALMSQLEELRLANNEFHGTIPAALFGLSGLRVVTLRANSFEGAVPRRASAVWLQSCDYSGLTGSNKCKVSCDSCRGGMTVRVEVELRACDDSGRRPWCLPVFGAVLLLVGTAVVVVALVSRLMPLGKVGALGLFFRAVYALTDTFTDVLFVMHSTGIVQAVSGSGLALTALLSVTSALRTLPESPNVRGAGALVAVGLVSVLHHASLEQVAGDSKLRRRVTKHVILIMVLEGLMQGSLQGASIIGGDTTAITIIAFSFSCASVASLVAVFSIIAFDPRSDSSSSAPRASNPERALTKQGSTDSGREGGREGGARGRRGLRNGAVWLLCCCVAVVAVATHGSAGGSQHVPIERVPAPLPHQRTVSHHTALQRTTAPSPRLAVAAKQQDCHNLPPVISIDLPEIAVFGLTALLILISTPLEDLLAHIDKNWDVTQILVATDYESSIPPQIGRMWRLLFLSFEQGEGTTPSQLGLLSDLQFLKLLHVGVEGAVPSQLGLTSCASIVITNTFLEGSLPSQLGLLPLQELQLALNPRLSGQLPTELFAIESFELLELEGAPLVLQLPPAIGRMANATRLVVSETELFGTLPTQLGQLRLLDAVWLRDSKLEGSLPEEIGALSNVRSLRMDKNRLSGPLPTSLGALTQLTTLDLSRNAFSGPIPSQLALLTALTALSLGNNALTGPVPSQLALLTALELVAIEDNALQGALPAQMSPAQRSVWLQECDHSGVVDGRACARDCPGCGFGGAQVLPCNHRGFDNACIPLWGVLLLMVMVTGMVGAVVKKLSPRAVSAQKFALLALGSSVAVFHWMADLLFAFNSDGVIRTLALLTIALAGCWRFVLSATEVHRLQLQYRLANIATRYSTFAIALVFCVLDPFTLQVVTGVDWHNLSVVHLAPHLRNRHRLKIKLLLAVLVSDIPLLALQAVSLARPGTVVVLAFVVTLVHLVVVSRAVPGIVRGPTSVHAARAQAQAEVILPPAHDDPVDAGL